MSMSLVRYAAAEGGETLHELPMPAYMYGVIALLAFALLLAVTWAFRGTAAKLGQSHENRARSVGHGHDAESGHH